LADAVLYLLQNYDEEPIVNIGWGKTVMSAIGYMGTLTFDHTKPDGTPRKLLDVSRLKIGLASLHDTERRYQKHLRVVQRSRIGRATLSASG
jgi:GDP-L-fucose synthase